MTRSRATALGALLLAIGLTGCGGAPRTLVHGSTGRAFALPVPESSIKRFAWIDSGVVARGGQPDDEGMRWLAEQGFRTVITFRKRHDEEAAAARAGLPLVEIPIHAGVFSSTQPSETQVSRFLSIVRDSTRRPVYFHCARGADRTGMFGAIYRIEVDGWTNDEAVEEMQAFGYNDVYKDLIRYVRDYRPRD